MENAFLIFLLALGAGMSTIIGSLLVFFIKVMTDRIVVLTLSFSAGVMLGVSFFELLPQSIMDIGLLQASLAFFIGMLVMWIIDALIPHEYAAEHECKMSKKFRKTGILMVLGIAIHNFPEGFAVFAGGLESLETGILLAVAIAMHNIPEGISVSVPLLAAGFGRKKAFLYSALSGLLEPIGALFGILFLGTMLGPFGIMWLLAFVAGIMVFISIDELIPAAHEYCNGAGHRVTLAFLIGMGIVVTTLVLMQ